MTEPAGAGAPCESFAWAFVAAAFAFAWPWPGPLHEVQALRLPGVGAGHAGRAAEPPAVDADELALVDLDPAVPRPRPRVADPEQEPDGDRLRVEGTLLRPLPRRGRRRLHPRQAPRGHEPEPPDHDGSDDEQLAHGSFPRGSGGKAVEARQPSAPCHPRHEEDRRARKADGLGRESEAEGSSASLGAMATRPRCSPREPLEWTPVSPAGPVDASGPSGDDRASAGVDRPRD